MIQISLQGFLDLRLKPWLRNLLTRSLAIVPSLIVALIGGSSGAGELIIITSVCFFYLIMSFTKIKLHTLELESSML